MPVENDTLILSHSLSIKCEPIHRWVDVGQIMTQTVCSYMRLHFHWLALVNLMTPFIMRALPPPLILYKCLHFLLFVVCFFLYILQIQIHLCSFCPQSDSLRPLLLCFPKILSFRNMALCFAKEGMMRSQWEASKSVSYCFQENWNG